MSYEQLREQCAKIAEQAPKLTLNWSAAVQDRIAAKIRALPLPEVKQEPVSFRLMSPDLEQVIHALYLRDATVHASILISNGKRLSESDALATVVLNLAKAKDELEAELKRHLAERQPSAKCGGQCKCQQLGDYCNGEHHPLCKGGAS